MYFDDMIRLIVRVEDRYNKSIDRILEGVTTVKHMVTVKEPDKNLSQETIELIEDRGDVYYNEYCVGYVSDSERRGDTLFIRLEIYEHMEDKFKEFINTMGNPITLLEGSDGKD